jgi:hypothetical protein
MYQANGWSIPRRIVAVRTKEVVDDEQMALFPEYGWEYEWIVTNLLWEGEDIWRFYNHRCGMENYIKEAKNPQPVVTHSSKSRINKIITYEDHLINYKCWPQATSSPLPRITAVSHPTSKISIPAIDPMIGYRHIMCSRLALTIAVSHVHLIRSRLRHIDVKLNVTVGKVNIPYFLTFEVVTSLMVALTSLIMVALLIVARSEIYRQRSLPSKQIIQGIQ